MSRADPALRPADPPPPARAVSPRDLSGEQIAMLSRLAEIGMEIAEAAGRMARALADGGEAGTDGADPGLTYARAARAVRLTIALQQKLVADRTTLDRFDAGPRRLRIRTHVERAIAAEHDDAEEARLLTRAVHEALNEADDADILDRPMEELVALICTDLGLPTTWAAAFGPASLTPPHAPPNPPSFSGLSRESSHPPHGAWAFGHDGPSRPLDSRDKPENDEGRGGWESGHQGPDRGGTARQERGASP